MTTTELIKLLKDNEYGGATGTSRRINFDIPAFGLICNPDIEIASTGDGLGGAEITLSIIGGDVYPEEMEGTENGER